MNRKKTFISYYKPHLALFLSDMFFAMTGAAITLVLTENGISEQGTHEELLSRGGVYAGFWNAAME